MANIEHLNTDIDRWNNIFQDVFSSISYINERNPLFEISDNLEKIKLSHGDLNLTFNYYQETESFKDKVEMPVIFEEFELPEKIKNISNEGSKYLIDKFKHSKILSQSHPTLDEENNIIAIYMKKNISTTLVFQSNQWVHVSLSKHGKHKAMLTAEIYLSEQEEPCEYLDKLVRLFENE